MNDVFRCPTLECQVAKPFSASLPIEPEQPLPALSTTTTEASISFSEQICIKTNILEAYASLLGQSYCEYTCLNQKMDFCNLIICTCITA